MTKPLAQPPSDYKIFCDESCHLDSDKASIMVFGAIYCPTQNTEEITRSIKALRAQFSYKNEIKWTKLISKQLPFYKSLIDLFFSNQNIRFKATVVLNKELLNHEKFNNGSHLNFYHKIAYFSLRDFLTPDKRYLIYFDYMNTQGNERALKLREILKNGLYGQVAISTQIIRSHESNLLQLCDLLIGAIGYANRTDIPKTSVIKNQIVSYIKEKSRRDLDVGTPPWEDKFNLFLFSPRS